MTRIFGRRERGLIGLIVSGIIEIIIILYTIFKFVIKNLYKLFCRLYFYVKYRKVGLNYDEMVHIIKHALPREFEVICANLFKANGYKVELTPPSNDHGKDIILNNNIYVECKHYSEINQIGREISEKLIGSCAENGVKHGIIVTTGIFHQNAIDYANKINRAGEYQLELWDMKDILNLVSNTTPDSTIYALKNVSE